MDSRGWTVSCVVWKKRPGVGHRASRTKRAWSSKERTRRSRASRRVRDWSGFWLRGAPAPRRRLSIPSSDFAYHWLIEIRHNSDPPVPGSGSAIFFHIRRGVNRPTTGCTTMAQENLVKLITWLRAKRHPCYALLPANEYDKNWRSWNLPSPDAFGRSGPASLPR